MNALQVIQGRARVVSEAHLWLRTPYHHQARLRGSGVDCAMLLCEVYERCGLVGHVDPRPYPPDWWMHRSEERFLGWVAQCGAVELPAGELPKPGDLAVYQFGRCFAHGAIIKEWPTIIHAFFKSRVCELARGDAGDLAPPRLVRFFTLWPEEAAQ